MNSGSISSFIPQPSSLVFNWYFAGFTFWHIGRIRNINEDRLGIDAIVELGDLHILMNKTCPYRLRITVSKHISQANTTGDDRPISRHQVVVVTNFSQVVGAAQAPAVRIIAQFVFVTNGGAKRTRFCMPA